MVAILSTALFLSLGLQMVLSLKLNVEIRETDTDGIGNSTADVIGVAAQTHFNVSTGLSYFVSEVKLVDEFFPGFMDTLTKAKELTIFAPTDVAFALADFIKDPAERKQRLLRHVVGKKIPSAAIKPSKKPQKLTTLSGETIFIIKRDQIITVHSTVSNTAKVVKADIFASNGVIHAIDEVIDQVIDDSDFSRNV
jgi:uncharacterized surface protein with fasciclin (FAS1) repeats